MTLQHLNVAHRMLKRQGGPVAPGKGPLDPGANGPGNAGGPGGPSDPPPGPDDGPNSSNGPQFTSASGSLSFPPRPTNPPGNDKPQSSSQAPPPPVITSSQPPAVESTTSSTASTPSTTTTSSSSSILSTTVVVPTTSSRSVVLIPGTTPVAASSFGTVPSITSLGSTPTSSASDTPSPTSGVSVGKVVGGIAGGLVGVAILGFLVSFILRRLRKRNRRNTFNDDDFRQSQFITDNNSNDPLSAPNMAQRTHNITPSIGSGPGMAGQGAYHQSNAAAMYGGDDAYNTSAPVAAGYGGAAGYGAAGYGATAAAGMGGAAAGAALHERPRYTYGQANDDEGSEIAHGAYSSQPQVQAPYNPEAYGSYAAYAGAPAGYQEATREYQAHPQQGGYAQGGYHDQQYGDGHYGVAVADPGPATATHVGAHSTSPSPRDPGTMNGSRGPNTRSVVQDDDVYGGI